MSNAPFPPFTSSLGRLRLEGMSSFHSISFLFLFYFSNFQSSNFFFFTDAVAAHPHLDKVYLDRIDLVRAFPGRSFHNLVTLGRLATWGLGPEPTAENHGHEETTRRSILYSSLSHFSFPFFFNFIFLVARIATMKENR